MENENLELRPVGKSKGAIAIPKKRNLLGSSDSCDVVISYPEISGIHAVLELAEGGAKLFDMNSKNGSYVNNEKVVVKEIKIGDKIKFANREYELVNLNEDDLFPPALDMLKRDPLELPKKTAPLKPELPTHIPTIEYPLGKDPKAEFSEYIFEDSDNLFPIFKYEYDKESIEVIMMFKDRIHSVDYLPVKNGTFRLSGSSGGRNDLEYVYLGRNEKVPFIEIKNSSVDVHRLSGFEMLEVGQIKGQDMAGSVTALEGDTILCFSQGDLQIFVRRSDSPPQVKVAPIFRRDKDLKKYLILMFLLVFLFLSSMTLFSVDKEKDKEKNPERIATILYKKPAVSKAISKTKKAPKKKIQKSPVKKQVVKKDKPKAATKKNVKTNNKAKAVAKSGVKTAKATDKAKKAKPRKAKKNVVKPVVKKPGKKRGAPSVKKARAAKRSTNRRKSKGRVDTYKSIDFKSTLSSLMAKGGTTKAVKAAADADADIGDSTVSDAGESATLRKAKVSKDVGSLTDDSGKLKTSRGVPGLVSKKSIYTAGLPDTIVVMGGMDPDTIRKIIMDNIPHFRYCYQKVLDRSAREFNGRVKLNFVIGASGHVTKAGVVQVSDSLPVAVRSCVVNVLKGIRFPEPPGGGIVEVLQPFNFMPNIK